MKPCVGYVQMQEAMLYRSWTQDISALPLCGAQMSAKGDLTWFGPRVKMGVCKDVPTRIMPHAISGRADYFGSFVNRWSPLSGCKCADAAPVTLRCSSSNQTATERGGRSRNSCTVNGRLQLSMCTLTAHLLTNCKTCSGLSIGQPAGCSALYSSSRSQCPLSKYNKPSMHPHIRNWIVSLQAVSL